MRIVASACLVLAVLFMVGCGTSAEDKKMIQDQGAKITTLENAQKAFLAKADYDKKIGEIETFLKGKFKDYGVPPPEVKPPEAGKPGAAAKPEPKKEEPKKTTPAKKAGAGTTK